ncbi:probable F-box protein At1g44080 [Cornus florida]|uniref:probable F-box protein At1g44080 n=1 Tax=Cornus florida TaxID=4283 RepID=UPI00289D8DB3|nr:probable F-box protein At1g44080 [Cornus florida]
MEVVKGEWLPSGETLNGSKLRHRKLMGQQPSITERGDSEYNTENIDPLDSSSFEHSTGPSVPLLMLNEVIGRENINFFSLLDGSVHGVKMPPELRGALCVGSSHGWLLMSLAVPTKSNSFFTHILSLPKEVRIKNFLFNPFNKDAIHLPSQTTLPLYGSDDQIFIRKSILSCAPTSDNLAAGKCMVVIICYYGNLAFCKPGDTSWSILDSTKRGFSHVDAVFYEEKLYAIRRDENLSIFNGLGSGEVTRINMVSPTDRETAIPIFLVDGQKVPLGENQTMYLVPSNGDLIMVLRIWNYEPENDRQILCPIRTVQFKVFKLDCSIPQWVEIKSLGDKMLFLGTSCSKSYSAAKHGFKGNSIFFTDDNFDAYLHEEDRPSELRDMGLFRLDKGSIDPYFLSRINSFSSRFIWVDELSCVD